MEAFKTSPLKCFLIQALYGDFTKKYIKMPDEEEAKKQVKLFKERSGFPVDLWGAIDGTQFPVNTLKHSYFSVAEQNRL